MPDSVRCSVDTSQGHHTVNCEVDFDPEPSASPASSAPPAAALASNAAPPAAQSPAPPAVAALVNRFAVSREVHATPVALVTASSAAACASQLMSAPILLMSLKNGPLAFLSGVKLGYDLGACLANNMIARQVSVDQAAAVKACEADGGIPSGFVQNDLMCLKPSAVQP